MRKKMCLSCKKEVASEGDFCPLCGGRLVENLDMDSKKKNKRKTVIAAILIVIVLVFVVGGGIATYFYLNSPVVKFQKELADYDYENATIILNQELRANEKDYNKAKEKVLQVVNDELEKYANNEIDYEKYEGMEMFLKENFSEVDCSGYDEKVSSIKTSKDKFINAKAFYETQNYLKALECYQKVIEDDRANYKAAQEAIDDCKNEYKNQLLTKIEENINSDCPENACQYLWDEMSGIQWVTSDADVMEQMNKLKKITKENVLKKVDKLVRNKSYNEAINYFAKLPEDVKESDEIQNKLEDIKKEIIETVKKKVNNYVKKGNLDKAIDVLDKNMKYDIDGTLEARKKEIKKKQKKNALAEFKTLKKQVTISYDSVDKNYNVVGKGYFADYINISSAVNVEARMNVNKEDQVATFFLVFGFQQSDWIFMENIKIVTGDYEEELDVDYLERETEVNLGSISEWVTFVDCSGFDAFYDVSVPKIVDPDKLTKKLTSAKKVVIRFSGERKRDHIVTDGEKRNIKNIRRLYELLNQYPEFFKEF